MKRIRNFILACAVFVVSGAVQSAAIFYDVTSYEAAVAALKVSTPNLTDVSESFEDPTVWAGTQPEVTSQGIVWLPSLPGLSLMTLSSSAVDGSNHLTTNGLLVPLPTDPVCMVPGTCGDGVIGFSTSTIYAASGYVRGPAAGTHIGVFLDGAYASAGAEDPIVSADWQFIGVVDDTGAGFNSFEFRDMDFVTGINGDGWHQIRSDAYTIVMDNAAVVPVPPAVWLFATGLLGLAGVARRRRPAGETF